MGKITGNFDNTNEQTNIIWKKTRHKKEIYVTILLHNITLDLTRLLAGQRDEEKNIMPSSLTAFTQSSHFFCILLLFQFSFAHIKFKMIVLLHHIFLSFIFKVNFSFNTRLLDFQAFFLLLRVSVFVFLRFFCKWLYVFMSCKW